MDATFGRVDANYGARNHWSAGATYTVEDTVSLGLAYHESKVDEEETGLRSCDGLIVASFIIDFSLR